MTDQQRHPSRRAFLKTSALVVGGGLASTTVRAAEGGDLGGGISLGVQSYTFRDFDLEQALKRMQALGLKYAEFFSKHIPQNSTPDQLAGILKMCKEYGVTPVGFGVHGFTKDHAANKKMFEFGKAIGIRYLSADPSPDSFDSLDKLCDEYKIAIAIHPHGPDGRGGLHRWYSAEVILKAVKDHNKLIGSCLDTGHLIRSAQLGQKLDPADQIRQMGDRNFGIHLKDHDNKRKTDVVFGSPEGALDVAGVLKALGEVKFKGAISIEYEANPADPSPDMKECVAYVRKVAKGGGQ